MSINPEMLNYLTRYGEDQQNYEWVISLSYEDLSFLKNLQNCKFPQLDESKDIEVLSDIFDEIYLVFRIYDQFTTNNTMSHVLTTKLLANEQPNLMLFKVVYNDSKVIRLAELDINAVPEKIKLRPSDRIKLFDYEVDDYNEQLLCCKALVRTSIEGYRLFLELNDYIFDNIEFQHNSKDYEYMNLICITDAKLNVKRFEVRKLTKFETFKFLKNKSDLFKRHSDTEWSMIFKTNKLQQNDKSYKQIANILECAQAEIAKLK